MARNLLLEHTKRKKVFSLSKMSGSERKELEKKLRSELAQFQMFKRKFFTRSITTVGVTKLPSVNGNEKNCAPSPPLKLFEAHWKPIEKKLAALDAPIKNEIQASKPDSSNKRRKISPVAYNDCKSGRTMHQMTKEEKHSLFTRLESHLVDLPDHIIDFLRRKSGNMNQSIGYIDIDIESLSGNTLFELQILLDEHLREREKWQQTNKEQCKMEVTESGVSSSWMHPNKDYDDSDEEIDICGDDGPILSYPTLELQKEADCSNLKCSSTNNSTSDSSSSSDSDSNSGSESQEEVSSPNQVAKDNSGNKSGSGQEKSDIMDPVYVNKTTGFLQYAGNSNELNCSEKYTDSKHSLVESNDYLEGKHAPAVEDKIYRAALLRNRFADTILKAREKMKTLTQDSKGDPEKLRQQREEIERLQKKEKARFQAEAKAAENALRQALADAENARRQAKADAAVEAKRKRELEREAARQALVKIEEIVEINEYSSIMKDLEMLRSLPAEGSLTCIDEKSLNYALDDLRGYGHDGCSPLEKLGLFLKVDDEEEEDGDYNIAPVSDAEEGEIV